MENNMICESVKNYLMDEKSVDDKNAGIIGKKSG